MQAPTRQVVREDIIEFLIANQGTFKEDVMHLRQRKEEWLATLNSVFRVDLNEQYEARIRQHIAFVTSHVLGIPAEYVIIELEKIELEDYLNA